MPIMQKRDGAKREACAAGQEKSKPHVFIRQKTVIVHTHKRIPLTAAPPRGGGTARTAKLSIRLQNRRGAFYVVRVRQPGKK